MTAGEVEPRPGPATAGRPPPPPASASAPPPAAYTEGGYGYGANEPPPPPPPKEGGKIPAFAVRVDPFNALLAGRMGLELEVQLWKFITAEVVPIFVVWQKPPTLNWAGRNDSLHQESNGLGPISGASIGTGFWLGGKPFRGYVLRATLTDYGYKYVARDDLGLIDRVNLVERRLVFSFGSVSRIGFFTIGGDIGLGVELNRRRRCIGTPATETSPTTAGTHCKDEALIQVNRDFYAREGSIVNLRSFPYPVVLEGRISLGFVFEL